MQFSDWFCISKKKINTLQMYIVYIISCFDALKFCGNEIVCATLEQKKRQENLRKITLKQMHMHVQKKGEPTAMGFHSKIILYHENNMVSELKLKV